MLGFGEYTDFFVVKRGNKHNIPVDLDPEERNSRKYWVVRSAERFFVVSVLINNGAKLNVFMIGQKEDLKNYKVEISVKTKIYWYENEIFIKGREEFSSSLKCTPNDFNMENKDNARGLLVPQDILDEAHCVEVTCFFKVC